jgi:hypothetical protein
MEVVRRFSEKQYSDGLESWSFVKLKRKIPLFTSPFGDVFFKARDGIWFLDTVGGSLKLICKTEADLQSLGHHDWSERIPHARAGTGSRGRRRGGSGERGLRLLRAARTRRTIECGQCGHF